MHTRNSARFEPTPWTPRILLSACIAWSPLFSPATGAQVEKFVLENGLTVLVQEDHKLPLVNVTCMYRVGSANEAPGITGIAHYVEHMNFRGTASVSKSDITGFVNRIGGRWNGYTSLDQTLYAATVPAWAVEEVLRIEAERMSRSVFDPADFERERTSVISELQGYENDSRIVLWDLGAATSFEIHPYRYNIIGWLTDVATFSRDQAYNFYRDFYGPQNAVLVLAGSIQPGKARSLVEKYFGQVAPARRLSAVTVQEPVQRGEKTAILTRPGATPRTILLYRAPGAADPDYPPLLVLDAILAGGRGPISFPGLNDSRPHSRLEEVAREADGSGTATSVTPTRAPYLFALSAECSRPEQLEHLEAALISELDRLATQPLPHEQLEQARLRLRVQRSVDTDRLADRAHRLAYFEGLGSWRLADSIESAIERVNSADIQRVIRKWLQPTNRTIVRLIPGDLHAASHRLDFQPLPAAADVQPSPLPTEALASPSPPLFARVFRTLENGIGVGVARTVGETAALHLRLNLGSRLDPEGKDGLALLAVRLLSRDRKARQELEHQGVLWRLEADPTSSAATDYFDFALFFPASRGEEVLEQLGRLLRPRTFTEDETARALAELGEEASSLAADAAWRARQLSLEVARPGWRTPYGNAETHRSVRAEDVNSFCAKHWKGGNISVGLAAPGEPDSWVPLLSRFLENLPAGETDLRFPQPAAVPRAGERHVALPALSQAEIVGVLPSVPTDHEDYLSIRLLNYILGETGYAGRLGTALVDRGLTYSVYASTESRPGDGLWFIRTGTDPARLNSTLSSIRRVLSDLSRGEIHQWELQEAQAFQLGRMVYSLDSLPGIAELLCDTVFLGEDQFDFQGRSARVLAVQLEELKAAARTYLDSGRLALGVAKPE